MELNLIDNYVYTRMLDLDLTQQKNTADLMYNFILDKFQDDGVGYTGQSTMTTKLYLKYNYLMYPVAGISKLYGEIRDTFHACKNHKPQQRMYTEYHMQCWLNYYNKGDYIDWHGHWPESYDGWHGFYCLDVEPDSNTQYKVPNNTEITTIESKNNLLVISKSDGDLHRSSEWIHEDRPRITIAFDIIPSVNLFANNHTDLNHWIPV